MIRPAFVKHGKNSNLEEFQMSKQGISWYFFYIIIVSVVFNYYELRWKGVVPVQ